MHLPGLHALILHIRIPDHVICLWAKQRRLWGPGARKTGRRQSRAIRPLWENNTHSPTGKSTIQAVICSKSDWPSNHRRAPAKGRGLSWRTISSVGRPARPQTSTSALAVRGLLRIPMSRSRWGFGPPCRPSCAGKAKQPLDAPPGITAHRLSTRSHLPAVTFDGLRIRNGTLRMNGP